METLAAKIDRFTHEIRARFLTIGENYNTLSKLMKSHFLCHFVSNKNVIVLSSGRGCAVVMNKQITQDLV